MTSEGLEWKPNPFDEYAVEAALRMLEDGVGSGKLRGELVVATIGPQEVTQQVRQCLAMGADRGILVAGTDEELDATVVARTLVKHHVLGGLIVCRRMPIMSSSRAKTALVRVIRR